MSRFLGIHKIPSEFDETQIREGFENYKKSAIASGLNPISAVYSMEKGFAYCQTDAESAEAVRKAHEAADVPIEDVIEVKTLS